MVRILLILFLCSSVGFAQKNSKDNPGGRYKQATLFKRDGDTLKGFVKFYGGFYGAAEMKFKDSPDDKPDKFSYKEIDGFILHGDSEGYFEYKILPGNKYPSILRLIQAGKVYLYSPINLTGESKEMSPYAGKNAYYIAGDWVRVPAYICFDNQDTMIDYFSEKGKDIMKGCPEANKLFETEKYKNVDALQAVSVFNVHCIN